MGWLSGYRYRKKGSVVATAAGAQTNYQEELLVGESSGAVGEDVDCEEHCRDFPNDMRFTGADGQTKHDYWVESITGVTPNRLATIWIEVASIPASGSVDLYTYYGKTSDSGESNGDDTFKFFDDFEEEFDTDFFLNDVARYGASNDIFGPQAIYHNNKTYIALHGSDLDPYAITYDHNAGSWSDKVYVGNNPLGDDGHGSPAILRDSNGYWHIFYGAHTTAIQHAKSTNVDDITVWTDKGDIGSDSVTYPHPVLADNGDIYVFFRRSHRYISYRKSIDDGENWSDLSTIIDFGDWNGGAYTYIARITHEPGTPEKVHMGYGRCTVGNYPGNLYYSYFNVATGKMYSANGTDLGVMITAAEADANCRIYESTNCVNPQCRIDSDGKPYILFNNNSTFKFVRWTGSSWTAPQNITTTTHTTKSLDFIVHSSTDIEAYLDVGNKIEKWLYNGSSWSKDLVVADGADYDNSICLPAVVENYTNNLKITFSQCLAGNNNKAFAYGDSGFKGDYHNILDTEKWNSAGSVSVANSKVLIQNANSEIYSKVSYGAGYALRGHGKLDDNTALGEVTFGFNNDIQDADCVDIYSYNKHAGAGPIVALVETNNVPSGIAMDEQESAAYRKFEIFWLDASSVKFRVDGGVIKEITTNIPGGVYPINLFSRYISDIVEFDYIFVSKYTFPEPTWGTWGSEIGRRRRSYAFIIG